MVPPIPKYFSKNAFSFPRTVCFFWVRLPPPNLLTGGIILSRSVPTSLIPPSLKELSKNFLVSSGFKFSSVISYYKYTDEDLIKRVSMLIKAREIADFDDMVKNYTEEVEEQVDKIKKVL